MSKIDLKYKIPLQGKYHKGVNDCPFCDHKPRYLHANTLGFADSNIGILCVIECPECFEKWNFHAREYEDFMHYEIFLQAIEEKTNIHHSL
jgi:hypothetical protein